MSQTASQQGADPDVPPFRYTPELAQRIELAWEDRWEAEGTFHTPNPTGRLAEGFAPSAQHLWRKRHDCGGKLRRRFAIAHQKCRQRFAMRQIKPATSRHQKFAARGRHRLIDSDARAARRQHLGRHQSGRTGADDGDLF